MKTKKSKTKSEPTAPKPEFIRLPHPGGQCPYTGLSRTKMNELVLPSPANKFKPRVRSISMRKRGEKRGIRLVSFDSLMEYLNSFSPQGAAA